MKQLYICLEGIDGVGKSTLANMLNEYLRESGYKTEILRTTKPSPDDHIIERVFARLRFLNKSRFLRFFLFAHRSNYAASVINRNSSIIIGDRSIVTSYAYRWRKSQLINKFHIMLVNIFEPRLPAPDYLIYCYADYVKIAERLAERKHREIDENAKRAAWVIQAYSKILSDTSIKRLKTTKTLYLDCNGSIDNNYAALIRTVKKILDNNKE